MVSNPILNLLSFRQIFQGFGTNKWSGTAESLKCSAAPLVKAHHQRVQWCVNVSTHNSVTLLNGNRMLVKTQILQAMRTQNPKSLQKNKSDTLFYTEEEVTDPGWKPSHHILILFIWGKWEGKEKHREKQLYLSVDTANEVLIGGGVNENNWQDVA